MTNSTWRGKRQAGRMTKIITPSFPGGTFTVPPSIVESTLAVLRRRRTEAVCYWLGRLSEIVTIVCELWIPEHDADVVSYTVTPEEMLRLKQHLDEAGLAIVAQIHSHPGAAFHSATDDQNAASPWPGFISIVVPRFGDVDDFWSEVEIYELIHGTHWQHVIGPEKTERFARQR